MPTFNGDFAIARSEPLGSALMLFFKVVGPEDSRCPPLHRRVCYGWYSGSLDPYGAIVEVNSYYTLPTHQRYHVVTTIGDSHAHWEALQEKFVQHFLPHALLYYVDPGLESQSQSP